MKSFSEIIQLKLVENSYSVPVYALDDECDRDASVGDKQSIKKMLGLQSSHCCDYILVHNSKEESSRKQVIFIEEKRIVDKLRTEKEKVLRLFLKTYRKCQIDDTVRRLVANYSIFEDHARQLFEVTEKALRKCGEIEIQLLDAFFNTLRLKIHGSVHMLFKLCATNSEHFHEWKNVDFYFILLDGRITESDPHEMEYLTLLLSGIKEKFKSSSREIQLLKNTLVWSREMLEEYIKQTSA